MISFVVVDLMCQPDKVDRIAPAQRYRTRGSAQRARRPYPARTRPLVQRDGTLPAAAFDHFSAIVAEFVFLTGKTIHNAPAAMFNAGAKLLCIRAAGAAMTSILG